jgi:UDP-N-acetylglucosamine 2-epimerase (non-hydrolysing)
VAIVIGTRPEAIKLAPIVRHLNSSPILRPVVISTGQHLDMVDQMLEALDVQVDVELRVMQDRQSLPALTASLMAALSGALEKVHPDAVLVQGDTTSAFIGALAAFYAHIPVGHVEAGLRSGSLDNPFPEELNRRLITRIARWNFAPTALAASRLLAEGVRDDQVLVTGNTVIDNLLWALGSGRTGSSPFATDRRHVLVTLHRRETQGPAMTRIAEVLMSLVNRDDVEVVLPMHPSPAVRESLIPGVDSHPALRLIEPLDYFDFIAAMGEADLIITDSGGVQEEAPIFGTPVLVVRETTERPEGIEAGTSLLVGTDPSRLLEAANSALDEPAVRDQKRKAESPFGDGTASPQIIDRLARDLRHSEAPTRGIAN